MDLCRLARTVAVVSSKFRVAARPALFRAMYSGVGSAICWAGGAVDELPGAFLEGSLGVAPVGLGGLLF